MVRKSTGVVLVATLGLAIGCSQNNGPTPGQQGKPEAISDPAVLTEAKGFLLDGEPSGAKGVIEVKKLVKDGDDVVVVGRVGGAGRPFTDGRASFLIVDPSLKPAVDCDCPWDYCESPKADLTAARVSVKFVDGQGKTLQAGAKEMFGLKELTTVVVKGRANRDEQGNLTVVASGIYVRKD